MSREYLTVMLRTLNALVQTLDMAFGQCLLGFALTIKFKSEGF